MKGFTLVLAVLLLVGCTSSVHTKVDESKDQPAAETAGKNPSAVNDQEKQALDRLQAYSWDAQELWTKFQSTRQPSRADFAGLLAATGVIIRDGNFDPVTMGKDRVERAVRLLSTTIQLGDGNPPPPERADYSLEFVGPGSAATVVLAKNAAYFEGKVYYCPELAVWLNVTLQADDGH